MKIYKENNIYYLIKDDQKMKIEPEIFQKYRLYNDFQKNDLNLIYQENLYQFYYKIALKKLSRSQSEFMLKEHLKEKGANVHIVNQVIHTLKNLGYLNDFDYAKNYVELKKNTYGPRKLQFNLVKNGVNQEIINQVLNNLEEEDILDQLISREVLKIKSSIVSFKQKLIQKFYHKGFSIDVVLKVVNKKMDNIVYDEVKDLKKEYQKLLAKQSKSISQADTKYKIRNKLLKKGYQLKDIKNIEEVVK